MRDRTGASAVEFALVLPLLAVLLFGIIEFGVALNNKIALTDGVRVAARELAIGRGNATPRTNAQNRFGASTSGLNPASLTLTLSVQGTACSTDAACRTALTAAVGQPASAIATYPCALFVFGIDFAPGCTLTSQTTERVE